MLHLNFLVNFPVVAGGFALLAATGATQAIVGGSTAFSTSVISGATGLLGRFIKINAANLEWLTDAIFQHRLFCFTGVS